MSTSVLTLDVLARIIGFSLFSCFAAFLWSPVLIHALYKYKIVRRNEYDPTLGLESRKAKSNVPVMGGLLIIVTVATITLFWNWSRSFTWVPIGVMLLSALLGGIDDLLNIFGKERRSRKLSQVMTLIRVHRDVKMRLWYALTLPWSLFKRTSAWLSKHPGKGIHVHEKLFLQFVAGAIAAWWIYFKLGAHFREIYVPFFAIAGSALNGDGYLGIGWLIIPLIIFIIMFTANAVNIADGMDGLAGGMLIPTFFALAILSWIYGYDEIAILNGTVIGALITYTYFNVKPARFQMGDVGSLGLGALLAINAIVINHMVVLFFLGFMFYVEAITVLIQIVGRYVLGRRIFKMAPLHHHFELLGWSEEKIVMRFWIIHLAFVFLGIWIALH